MTPDPGLDLRDLPALYCLLCGRPALAPGPHQTVCSEGHRVHVPWLGRYPGDVPPQDAPGAAGDSWRDRPPLL